MVRIKDGGMLINIKLNGEPWQCTDIFWAYDDSDLRVASGNYLRLQSLSLRYLFPRGVG